MNIDGRDIYAESGKILTNGQAYEYSVKLGAVDSPENWREITEAEYEDILKKQREDSYEATTNT